MMIKKIIAIQQQRMNDLRALIGEANETYIRDFRKLLRSNRSLTLADTYALPLGPFSNIHTISIDAPNARPIHFAFSGIDPKTNPFLDPDYQHPVDQIRHDLIIMFGKHQVRCCQSITKSFVGYTFIKILEGYNRKCPSNKILLNKSISQLFGPNPSTGDSFDITFQDVLNMTTGIRWKHGTEHEKAEFTDPKHPLREMLTSEDPFQFVFDKIQQGTEPGRFEYSAAMSVFLAKCIEKLVLIQTGENQPYHEVVNKIVGVKMPWYTWPKSGLSAPSSGAHLNHDALYKFTKKLASDPKFLAHLLNTRVRDESKSKGFYYSNQFWIVELNKQTGSGDPVVCFEIAMFGNGGQRASIVLEKKGEELNVLGTYLVQAGDYSSKSLTRFYPGSPLLKNYILPYLGLHPLPVSASE